MPIAATVPVYLLVLTPAAQSRSVPQSVTTRLSLVDSRPAETASTMVPLLSVNGALSEPVFLMSTTPVVAGLAGRRGAGSTR